MAKPINNESEMIKQYLKKMDSSKFLSKKEEQIIGARIKKIEKDMLKICLKSAVFMEEFEKVCDAVIRNPNNAVKYSKKLIADSPDEDKARIAEYFQDIKKLMVLKSGTKADSILLSKFVGYIGMTSSALYQMLLPLKQKYDAVKNNIVSSENLYKFLEIETAEEYNELANSCQDSMYRRKLARKLYTNDETLIKRLRQQEEVLKFYLAEGLDEASIKILKDLITAIGKLEAKYKEDRETLIHANLPLVVSRAKRFTNHNMNLEDLIQEGNIGLIKAVDKYDPDKNVKITTYATWWIDQAIRRSISNKSRLVRVPTHVQQNIKKINSAFFALSQRLLREPTNAEISKYTEIPIHQIEEINQTALHEVGIDSEISQGLSYNDILFDKNQRTVFQETSKSMLKDKIRVAIADLSPRSQKVIMLRFGIGMPRDHTLEEIGSKFSVSKQRIRQIETKALVDLKKGKKIPKERS